MKVTMKKPDKKFSEEATANSSQQLRTLQLQTKIFLARIEGNPMKQKLKPYLVDYYINMPPESI